MKGMKPFISEIATGIIIIPKQDFSWYNSLGKYQIQSEKKSSPE